MKYCPNADCSYARKFKRPGEYSEVATTCSDCGAALTSVAPALPVAPAPSTAVKPSDANTRLAVTLGAAVAQLGLAHLTVSGAPPSLYGDDAPLPMLAVGMVPFATAFVLVEFLALAVPPLRPLRVGGAHQRVGLDWLAWGLGTVFLVLQLFALTRAVEATGALPPAGLLWAQFGLAHAAMVGLAFLVNRAGLGNGFALLMALEALAMIPAGARKLLDAVRSESVAPLPVLMFVAALAGAAALAVFVGRAGRGRGEAFPSAAPNPVTSTTGWGVAISALTLPATLSVFLPEARWLEQQVRTSMGVYFALFAFIAVDAALIIGVLSFRPRAIGALWKRWVPGVDEIGVVAAARSLLPRALAYGVGLTVVLPFLVMVLTSSLGLGAGGSASLLAVVAACAVADIQDEWRALRRLGPLVSVWEVQRTAEVEPIVHLLKGAGIEAHARSFLLRATQQFFAPWIPVSILVPVARADEARALLSR